MTNNNIIDSSKFDVYAYGLEILIAYICYFVIFYIIAIITRTFLESTMFCVGFVVLRKFSGGFHASTYLKCHLLFAINHLLFIILLKTLPETFYNILFFCIPVFAFFSIWVFSPVDHENRPFNENEYAYFKKCSKAYSIVIIILSIILSMFRQVYGILFSYLIGVLSASCSIIVGKIQQHMSKVGN